MTKDCSGEPEDKTASRAEEPNLERTLRILKQWFTRWDSENSSISTSWALLESQILGPTLL